MYIFEFLAPVPACLNSNFFGYCWDNFVSSGLVLCSGTSGPALLIFPNQATLCMVGFEFPAFLISSKVFVLFVIFELGQW